MPSVCAIQDEEAETHILRLWSLSSETMSKCFENIITVSVHVF